MGIVTKRGDKGETSLCYGGRVSKDHPRPEAYGTVDEAISLLGLARSLSKSDGVQEIILSIQKDLSVVNVELATAREKYEKIVEQELTVTADMVAGLDAVVDELEKAVQLPQQFIVPGGCPASAALDVARTVIRRAERRVVGLRRAGEVENDDLMAYLNRASDVVFLLARLEEAVEGVETE